MDWEAKIIVAVFIVAAVGGTALVLVSNKWTKEYDDLCASKGGVPVHYRDHKPMCFKPESIIK